jgi:hypothetical protein
VCVFVSIISIYTTRPPQVVHIYSGQRRMMSLLFIYIYMQCGAYGVRLGVHAGVARFL